MNRFYLNKEYTVNCNRPWARDPANYKGNHRNECHVRVILFRGRVPDVNGQSRFSNFLMIEFVAVEDKVEILCGSLVEIYNFIN